MSIDVYDHARNELKYTEQQVDELVLALYRNQDFMKKVFQEVFYRKDGSYDEHLYDFINNTIEDQCFLIVFDECEIGLRKIAMYGQKPKSIEIKINGAFHSNIKE